MAPRPRLYVQDALADGLAVPLDAAQVHKLRDVLRLAPGADLILFNGRDGEWSARIERLARSGGEARAEAVLRPQAVGPDLVLCFAPVKRDATDLIVEKAVELGVAMLQPVVTRRTEAARVNLERLRAIAVEAAQQCERLDVPAVAAPLPLDRLVAGWPAGRPLLLCAESGTARPLAEVAASGGPAGILTGPEGGFTPEEIDLVLRCPDAIAVGLGPRILRAETAALAALAVWQAVAGDWRVRPPRRI
jgi:16S rRNA (uracil1498-N3)-methyltransferase